MNRQDVKQKVDEIFRLRQEDNLAKNQQKIHIVSEKSPEIMDAINSRHQTIMQGLKNKIGKPNSSKTDIVDYIKEKNKEIKQLLVKNGFDENYLQPHYNCNICKDEGVLYEPQTHKCDCYIKEYNKIYSNSLGIMDMENKSFQTYDENVYSNNIISKFNMSQREYMNRVRNGLKLYVDEFPNNTKTTKNLMFIGPSGLSKTFMMNAIQKEIAKKYYSVILISAYNWFKQAKDSYFGNSDTNYDDLLYCDLLMIDDLGTEPLMNNITVETLFTVINERQTRNLHTIISTNLSMVEFAQRYTERIVSRLEDRRYSSIINFDGEDIRKNMKKG